MTTPTQRLNSDLSRLKRAQRAEKKQTAAIQKSQSTEKKALDQIKTDEQKVIDSFTQSPPTDPAAIAAAFGKLFQLGQQSVQTKDRFDAQVTREKAALKKDKGDERSARKAALSDLKPAEYQMGLSQTNRDRKMLGLKPLSHPLRQPGKVVTAYYNGVPRQIHVVPVGNGQYLRADAAAAYKKMVAAAAKAGIHLTPESGFRSMAEQRHLYQLYLSGQGNLAARPGYSNHQGGVAMDIGGVDGYGTRAYNWLASHAGHYGFRNTVGGEFWHWSYGVNG